jgi:hypothetical protein
MERLLNATTVVSIILLVMVLVSVRKAHIRVEYSVSWLLASAALIALSRAHPLVERIAGFLGVPGSPVVLLLIAGSVFLIMFFRFSVIVSRLRDDNIALAQRVAIMEYHLNALRNRTTGNSQV